MTSLVSHPRLHDCNGIMFLGGLGYSKTSEKRMPWGQYKLTVVPFVERFLCRGCRRPLLGVSKCIKTIGKSILKSDLCREVYYNISLVILEGPLLEVLCTSTLQYHACACAEGSHPDLEILGAWE